MASKNKAVRAIEIEAKRRSLADDGKTSPAERFAIRAQLRDEAGLGKEQRERGGFARVYDANKKYVKTAVSLAHGGLGRGLVEGLDRPGESGVGFDWGNAGKGVLSGAGERAIGQVAGGALVGGAGLLGIGPGLGGAAAGAVPAAGAAGAAVPGAAGTSAIAGAVPAAGGLGGFLDKAKGFLTPDNILMGLQGLNAARGMARETDLTNEAVGLDRNRWRENAPLRDAGMEGLLNPQVADTSALSQLSGQGNPFALPVPSPSAAPPPLGGAMPPLGAVPVPSVARPPQPGGGAMPAPRRDPRFGGLR
ncbi:MAG: hypothetical protein AAB368_07125 [bacterium]